MTYSDIYTKFLIEYDKQNITSSYPSLTVYEIGTILDKAYLALIAQKLTGNNPRRAPFEIDIKAIEDLRPLITTLNIEPEDTTRNIRKYKLPIDNNFLYYISASIECAYFENMLDVNLDGGITIEDVYAVYYAMQHDDLTDLTGPLLQLADVNNDGVNDAQDVLKLYEFMNNYGIASKIDPITLINHQQAQNFLDSSVNMPWIKTPMGYLEDEYLYVFTDPYEGYDIQKRYGEVLLTYIKQPTSFITEQDAFNGNVDFALNDSMAEELINLAIVMALETVESPRIQMKEQTRALES